MKVYLIQDNNGYEGMGHAHGVFSTKAKAERYLKHLGPWSNAEICEINLDPVFIPKTKYPGTRGLMPGPLESHSEALLTKWPDYSFLKLLDSLKPADNNNYSWNLE